MLRINPIARTAARLIKQSSAGFCINQATLDPSKHITMNHNPHNMYVDAIDIGQYEEMVFLSSVASKAYQPQVLAVTAQVLNNRYVLFNLFRVVI